MPGLALLTAGFFAVHGVASGWVPARAHAGGVATGQAASLYLFTYYLGSSVFGSLAGPAWRRRPWPGVVALAVLLLASRAGCPSSCAERRPCFDRHSRWRRIRVIRVRPADAF